MTVQYTIQHGGDQRCRIVRRPFSKPVDPLTMNQIVGRNWWAICSPGASAWGIPFGWLQGPVHVPAWADLRLLAANLAFSAFISRIKLDVLDLEVLMAFADEHEADASAWRLKGEPPNQTLCISYLYSNASLIIFYRYQGDP